MAILSEHLERAVALAKAFGATRLILFGSAVTEPSQARDLDLACDGVIGQSIPRCFPTQRRNLARRAIPTIFFPRSSESASFV